MNTIKKYRGYALLGILILMIFAFVDSTIKGDVLSMFFWIIILGLNIIEMVYFDMLS